MNLPLLSLMIWKSENNFTPTMFNDKNLRNGMY